MRHATSPSSDVPRSRLILFGACIGDARRRFESISPWISAVGAPHILLRNEPDSLWVDARRSMFDVSECVLGCIIACPRPRGSGTPRALGVTEHANLPSVRRHDDAHRRRRARWDALSDRSRQSRRRFCRSAAGVGQGGRPSLGHGALRGDVLRRSRNARHGRERGGWARRAVQARRCLRRYAARQCHHRQFARRMGGQALDDAPMAAAGRHLHPEGHVCARALSPHSTSAPPRCARHPEPAIGHARRPALAAAGMARAGGRPGRAGACANRWPSAMRSPSAIIATACLQARLPQNKASR
jgi:hypothetical protein